MSDKKHAKLAPSASHRWISCPGSIRLCEQVPEPPESPYALEGTKAHELAEKCLRKKCNATTDEMGEAVQVYLDAVRELEIEDILIEEKFDLSWLHKDIFGSNDACVYDSESKTLHIFDYKHGKGVVVEPEWNSQLLMYALGATHNIWAQQKKMIPVFEFIEKIELIIVQPRAYHPEGPVRKWEISSNDLYHWALHVLKPAALKTEDPGALLHVGKHCRFCPALAVCPEQIRNACAIAKTDFGDPILPEPYMLSVNDIVKVMHVSEVFKTWADQVVSFAQSQLEAGVNIPGYKLVERRANRKWVDDNETCRVLETLLGESTYEKKVLSVAKAEKAIKALGQSPEYCLEGLWEKPASGLVIAPESDKRKAVQVGNAALDFLEDADFLQ